MVRFLIRSALAAILLSFGAAAAPPKTEPAPPRRADEGIGPFKRLVIRGVTVIDGTGGPPYGPMDVVIEGNRITDILSAGTPGLPLKTERPPKDAAKEIDASGMYLLPGFVDNHAHGAPVTKARDMSYAYKLWMAHGVTTIRGVPLADYETSVLEKKRSAANAIVAPRIFNYQTLGSGWPSGRIDSPAKAREWVRWAAGHDIDGIKFFNRDEETPEIDRAALDEARKVHLGSLAHLSQNNVAMFNADQATEAGLETVTHFYGHFESLLKDVTIQPFPADYNYQNEAQRFGEVASIARYVVPPDSEPWNAYLQRLLKRGVTLNPTFNIYSASRDLARARNAEWHDAYTTPRLWKFFQSTRDNHGSYFYDWTSENEVAWKRFFVLFEHLVEDYKELGGRVTIGTDPGFIFKTWGFSYVEEMEMFREAGFTPLEILRCATANGAAELYRSKSEAAPFGLIRRGMLADLVIVPENPVANLKVLYGTGHLRLNDATNKVERVGGVKYTIKDGIVYDAKALLADVAAMVAEEKKEQH